MKRMTIKDVAKKAGVDSSTVSLVLSNNKRIPEKTKEKIWKIINKLNYRPSVAAQTLAKGKTNNIAVVSIGFSSWYEMTVFRGIEKVVDESGYTISFFATGGYKKKENSFFLDVLNGNRADAVIGLSVLPDKKILSEMKKKKIPFISVGEQHKGFINILMDDYTGAYMAASRLVKNNRKRPALITGLRVKGFPARDILERRRGFKQALYDNGVEFGKEREIYTEDYSFDAGIRKFSELIKKNKKIDGIFCAAGDNVAIGVIKEAGRLGVNIPGDISLIGFDDIEMARGVVPELTTIKQPVADMGEAAFKTALNALKGGKPGDIIFKPELIIRQSA